VIPVLLWELIFWNIFFICVNTNYVIKNTVLFLSPERFIALGLVVVAFVFACRSLCLQHKTLLSFGKMTLKTIAHPRSAVSVFCSFFWFRNALVFLIIAWTEPFFGTKKVSNKSKNMEIVVSLDVSNSMNVCDIDPKLSRLEVAKRSIKAFIDQMEGEKIGISIFAGNAYTYLPLTTDYQGAKIFVDDIQTSMVSTQGTHVKIALYDAYKMFSEDKNIPKTVLLITDGGNHEENPTLIFKRYKKRKIQFLVIGIGTLKGGLIPCDPNNISLGYKKDAMGATVVSKLNVQFIKHIANLGKGQFMLSHQTYPDLRTLLKKIKYTDNESTQQIEINIKKQQYLLPLAISIVCYILWLIHGQRNRNLIKQNSQLNKLNLRSEKILSGNKEGI